MNRRLSAMKIQLDSLEIQLEDEKADLTLIEEKIGESLGGFPDLNLIKLERKTKQSIEEKQRLIAAMRIKIDNYKPVFEDIDDKGKIRVVLIILILVVSLYIGLRNYNSTATEETSVTSSVTPAPTPLLSPTIMVSSETSPSPTELGSFSTWSEITAKGQHQKVVNSVDFAPDGMTFISGSDDGTVLVWETATGNIIWGGPPDEVSVAISSVAYSPKGNMFAAGTRNGNIYIWDVAKARFASITLRNEDEVWSIAFSSDGTTIAAGLRNQKINLWSVEQEKIIYTLEGHTAPVWSVAFSPDGETLASAGTTQEASNDTAIKLWNVSTGKFIADLEGHKKGVLVLAFSLDGRLLSGSVDHTAILWDISSRGTVAQITEHTGNVYGVGFLPDNILVTGSFDGSIRLFDPVTHRPSYTLDSGLPRIWSLDVSHDGEFVAVGLADGTIRIWRRSSR